MSNNSSNNLSKTISWARIRFESDKQICDKEIKHINYAKNDHNHIQPENDKDFNQTHRYYARWDCDKSCDRDHRNGKHYAYHAARILLLGGKFLYNTNFKINTLQFYFLFMIIRAHQE